MREPIRLKRGEWNKLHRTPGIITASMVPTIIGLNRWESPYTLYMRMVGKIPWQRKTRTMQVGHRMESLLAQWYRQDTGRKTENPGAYAMWRHPDFDWLLATPDIIAEGERAVELKCLSYHALKALQSGGAPEHQLQNHVQMACMETEYGGVAGLAGMAFADSNFFFHDAEYDAEMFDKVLPRLHEFRERVLNGDPPPVDASDSTTNTLKFLHPNDNGKTVTLPVSLETKRQLAINEWKPRIRELEAKVKALENELRAAIGDATYGEVDGETISHKTIERKPQIRVRPEYRELLDASQIPFTETPASSYRRLNYGG